MTSPFFFQIRSSFLLCYVAYHSCKFSFLGCKFSLAAAMTCYILYMIAHFYATWGLFVPAAVILGLGAAPLWTAKGQYLNLVTRTSCWPPQYIVDYISSCIFQFVLRYGD